MGRERRPPPDGDVGQPPRGVGEPATRLSGAAGDRERRAGRSGGD